MPTPATPRLIDACDPRVAAFRTAAFSLADDLDWLDRLRGQRASVSVVLHAARILEVLVREAATATGRVAPRDGLNECLRVLTDYHLLTKDAYRLLDRLRDLGNKARHVLRPIQLADAEQGYAILLRALQWYFCEFPRGPRLKTVTVHNQPLDALLPADAAALLALLESADLNGPGFLDTLHLERRFCPVLLSPVLASVLVERLLDGDRPKEAQVALTAALGRFLDDVRLRQLQGLLWSRGGKLAEACTWLEAIGPADSAADEETDGILAGAYKQRADVEPERSAEWLRASRDKYVGAWRKSRQTNAYVGVNAAATALWVGLDGETATTAAMVRALMERRQRGSAASNGADGQWLSCWDQLTLAEACLLLRDYATAGRCYREATERYPRQTKALEVARVQAAKDLKALGRPELMNDIFPK